MQAERQPERGDALLLESERNGGGRPWRRAVIDAEAVGGVGLLEGDLQAALLGQQIAGEFGRVAQGFERRVGRVVDPVLAGGAASRDRGTAPDGRRGPAIVRKVNTVDVSARL